MKFVTFNPFRTLGIPNVTYVKPENMFKEVERIKEADYLLFPEYWQVNALVYGLNKSIFPSISTYHLGHNKVETTRALQCTYPDNVPYTKIMSSFGTTAYDIERDFGYPLVAKEIKNSMGKGVFLIENRDQLQTYMNNNEVLYIQERLPIDRDLRVVFVGDRVICAYWRIAPSGGFHNNIAKGASYDFNNIPEEDINLVENVAKSLKVNHAGFDVAVVKDKLYILEFNVMFGNEGLRKLGVPVEKFIYEYITSNPEFTPNNPILPKVS